MITSSSRRSLLQLRIIGRLTRGPAKTVTELAASVSAQRPAVSRSLKSLEQQGLVQRGKECWKVTEAGRAEAKGAATKVADVLEAAQKVSTILDWRGLGLGLDIAGMQELLRPKFEVMMDFGQLYQSLAPPAAFTDQLVKLSVSDQLKTSLSEAMQPLLDASAKWRSFLGGIASSKAALAGVADMMARNNALVAGALENMQGLSVLAQLRNTALDELLYSGVADHVRSVSQTYKGLLDWQTERMAPDFSRLSPEAMWRDITVPTVTVSSYTRSLRWTVHRDEGELPPLEQLDFEEGAGSQLDDLLGSLNPRFVDMRHGSWQALRSNNPDKSRHAAVSYRELVRELLTLLVPDAMVSNDVPGSKMKSAIKRLLGGSESSAEFAVAVSDAIYGLYSYLSKPVHTGYRHPQAVRAALLSGEGLLLFLLVHRPGSEAQ